MKGRSGRFVAEDDLSLGKNCRVKTLELCVLLPLKGTPLKNQIVHVDSKMRNVLVKVVNSFIRKPSAIQSIRNSCNQVHVNDEGTTLNATL